MQGPGRGRSRRGIPGAGPPHEKGATSPSYIVCAGSGTSAPMPPVRLALDAAALPTCRPTCCPTCRPAGAVTAGIDHEGGAGAEVLADGEHDDRLSGGGGEDVLTGGRDRIVNGGLETRDGAVLADGRPLPSRLALTGAVLSGRPRDRDVGTTRDPGHGLRRRRFDRGRVPADGRGPCGRHGSAARRWSSPDPDPAGATATRSRTRSAAAPARTGCSASPGTTSSGRRRRGRARRGTRYGRVRLRRRRGGGARHGAGPGDLRTGGGRSDRALQDRRRRARHPGQPGLRPGGSGPPPRRLLEGRRAAALRRRGPDGRHRRGRPGGFSTSGSTARSRPATWSCSAGGPPRVRSRPARTKSVPWASAGVRAGWER